MRLLILIPIFLLAACETTAPVVMKFPDAPTSLQTACVELKQLTPTDKLSEVMISVTDNYSLYHECRLKVEAWQDWHRKQKEIFEEVQ